MDQIDEYNRCVEELRVLRAKVEQLPPMEDTQLPQSIAEIQQKIEHNLKVTNRFFANFAEKSDELKEIAETDRDSIVRLGRKGSLHFNQLVSSLFEVFNEASDSKTEDTGAVTRELMEVQNTAIKRAKIAEFNSGAINSGLEVFMKASDVISPNSDDDFSVITFNSDDLSTSSPLRN